MSREEGAGERRKAKGKWHRPFEAFFSIRTMLCQECVSKKKRSNEEDSNNEMDDASMENDGEASDEDESEKSKDGRNSPRREDVEKGTLICLQGSK